MNNAPSVTVWAIDALQSVEKPHASYRVLYDGVETFRMVLIQTLHAKMASPPHAHDGAAELYLVLHGEIHVVTEGGTVRVPEGHVALVPAGVPHGVRNEHQREDAVTMVMLGSSFRKDGVRPHHLNPSAPQGTDVQEGE